MTISCDNTSFFPIDHLSTENDSSDTIIHNNSPTKQKWVIPPNNTQGRFFKFCVNRQIVDWQGNWIYPVEKLVMPPISRNCFRKIDELLTKNLEIEPKSLTKIPKRKRQIVLKNFDRFDAICKEKKVENPISIDKKRRKIYFTIDVNLHSIFSTLIEKYPQLIQRIEIHGGGLPYLLGEDYYDEAFNSNIEGIEQVIDKDLLEPLEKKPSDYDFRVIFNRISFEEMVEINQSIVEILATSLIYSERNNPYLQFIIRETAFTTFRHVLGSEGSLTNHFTIFSFENQKKLQCDITLVDVIANPQLFHCHGLAMPLNAFFSNIAHYPLIPYGSVAKGWKALFDKLANIITFDNPNHPYYKGWHRIISSFSKGMWTPNPLLEKYQRNYISDSSVEQLVSDQININSQHNNCSLLSDVCTFLTISRFMNDHFTEGHQTTLWNGMVKGLITKNSKLTENHWMIDLASSICNESISVEELAAVLQIGTLLQAIIPSSSELKSVIIDGSEGAFASIGITKDINVYIPFDCIQAFRTISAMLSSNREQCLALVELMLEKFIGESVNEFSNFEESCPRLAQQLPLLREALIDDPSSSLIVYIRCILKLQYCSITSIYNITSKMLKLCSELRSKKLKIILIHEFENRLKREKIIYSNSNLINFRIAAHNNEPIDVCNKWLLNELFTNSIRCNSTFLRNMWAQCKGDIHPKDFARFGWILYNQAKKFDTNDSLNILNRLLKNSRYISKGHLKAWKDEVSYHLHGYQLDLLISITELIIRKSKSFRKKPPSYMQFDLGCFLTFMNKLNESNRWEIAWRVVLSASNKNLIWGESKEFQSFILKSIHRVLKDPSNELLKVIRMWNHAYKHNFLSKMIDCSEYVLILGELINRCYDEQLESLGDILLQHCPEHRHNELSQIVNGKIREIIDANSNSGNFSECIDRYSVYLSDEIITSYKLKKVMSEIKTADKYQCITNCIELLYCKVNASNSEHFSNCLEYLLERIVNDQEVSLIEMTHKLLTHENLPDYLPIQTIGVLILWNVNFRKKGIEHDISSIEVASFNHLLNHFIEYYKEFKSQVVVELIDFLKRLLFKVPVKGEEIGTLKKLLSSQLSNVIAFSYETYDHEMLLTFYNYISDLSLSSSLQSKDYNLICTSLQSLMNTNNNRELIRNVSQSLYFQVFSEDFIQSEKHLSTILSVLTFYTNENEPYILECWYKRCILLLKKYTKKDDRQILIDQLVNIQSSKQISLHTRHKLLQILQKNRTVDDLTVFNLSLEMASQLDFIHDMDASLSVISQLKRISKKLKKHNLFFDTCLGCIKGITSKLECVKVPQLIRFTSTVIADNAKLWTLFFEPMKRVFGNHECNQICLELYDQFIKGSLKGDDSDVNECLVQLFSIVEITPSPFIDKFLCKYDLFFDYLDRVSIERTEEIASRAIKALTVFLCTQKVTDRQLFTLISLRSNILNKYVEVYGYNKIQEFDLQLIQKGIVSTNHDVYYTNLCLLGQRLSDNPDDKVSPNLFVTYVLNFPARNKFSVSQIAHMAEVVKQFMEVAKESIFENRNKTLQFCKSLVHINHEHLFDYSADITLKLLDTATVDDPANNDLQEHILSIMKTPDINRVEHILNHSNFAALFPISQKKKMAFNLLTTHLEHTFKTDCEEKYIWSFHYILEHLKLLDNDYSLLVPVLSKFWKLTIILLTKSENFSYSLDDVHKQVCALVFSSITENHQKIDLMKCLWEGAKDKIMKSTPQIPKVYYSLTTDLVKQLLSVKHAEQRLATEIMSFLCPNIIKLIEHYPKERNTNLMILHNLVETPLIFVDETLFDYSIKSFQLIYAKGFESQLFDKNEKLLLKYIYLSELKDNISSTLSVQERRVIFEKMIDHLVTNGNHVSLRHAFTMLTSVGKLLYLHKIPKLLSLYKKLLSISHEYLYSDLHYVFYGKNRINDEVFFDSVRLIIGSSPQKEVVEKKLESVGAHLSMVPLFECIRQTLMPGDRVLFTDWHTKHSSSACVELIDAFFMTLLEASILKDVPGDKDFDKYNITRYLCDALIKSLEFHAYDGDYTKYFKYVQMLAPHMIMLLKDPRLNDRDSVYDVIENLLFKEIKDENFNTDAVNKVKLLAIHSWIIELLQSKDSENINNAKKIFSRALGQLLYKNRNSLIAEIKMYYPT